MTDTENQQLRIALAAAREHQAKLLSILEDMVVLFDIDLDDDYYVLHDGEHGSFIEGYDENRIEVLRRLFKATGINPSSFERNRDKSVITDETEAE